MHQRIVTSAYYGLSTLLIMFVGGSCCTAIWLRHQYGVQVLSVQTGSMAPTFDAGDGVITERQPLSMLRTGDIIAYRSHRNKRVIISHRIIALDASHKHIVTKGDNLPEPDQPIDSAAVIGTVIGVAPHYAQVMRFLRSAPGLAIFLYLPATIIVGAESLRYFQSRDSMRYKLHDNGNFYRT